MDIRSMGNKICLRLQILFIVCMIAEIGFLFIWVKESIDTEKYRMTEKDALNNQQLAPITLDLSASNITEKITLKEQNISVRYE